MKYFTSQRLNFKHNSLDRYDLLDHSSENIRITSMHCTLKNNLGNKNLQLTKPNFYFANHLVLEWICNQKIKRGVIGQRFSGSFLVTTLRKTKLTNFIDTCLNFLFLSNNMRLSNSTDYFTLNFIPDSIIHEFVVSNNVSKILLSSTDKINFTCKSNFQITQYLKVSE